VMGQQASGLGCVWNVQKFEKGSKRNLGCIGNERI
jgi:hypothetical protein